MKKNRISTLILLLAGGAFLIPVLTQASSFNLSVDGVYNRRLSGFIGHDNGCGGSLLLEYQPQDSFSFGVGMDMLDYWGTETPGQVLVESVDLVGRFIFNPNDPLPIYLLGEAGINPKVGDASSVWPGDLHLMAGLGVRAPMATDLAFDFGVGYDYRSATNDDLSNLQARLGLTLLMGKTMTEKPKATAIQTKASVAAPTTKAVVAATPTTSPVPAKTKVMKQKKSVKN